MESRLETGQLAPDFQLQDLQGQIHTLTQYRGWIVLLNFWSAECPWSERVDRLLRQQLEHWEPEVVLLTIAVNLNEPLDLLEHIAATRDLEPVLRDPDQAAADLYGAQTTPHFFILDRQGILRYQGAYDDVTFRQRAATRSYVVEAVVSLLEGDPPSIGQTPAYGCTIIRLMT